MQPALARSLVEALRQRNADACRLARLASFAADVHGDLLRNLRLHFLPRSDASAEADLWLSEIVSARNSRGIVLIPAVVEVLRQQLASPPPDEDDPRFREPLHTQVWEFLRARHPTEPPLVRIEEELNWLAFSKAEPARIESTLGEVLMAMIKDPNRSRDLSAWSRRTLPALPDAIRNTRAAWLLALGASARLEVPTELGGEPPSGMMTGELPELFPSALGEVLLEIRRVGPDQVQVGEAATPRASDALVVPVPRTRPLMLEVLAAERSVGVVSLEPGEWPTLELPAGALARGEVSVRALNGKRWRIRAETAGPNAPQPEAPKERSLGWLHLSDLQIDSVRGHDVSLDTMVRELEHSETPVELMVVSGDVSYTASAEDFVEASRWLEKLAGRAGKSCLVLAVPGNHDVDVRAPLDGGPGPYEDEDPFWSEREHPLRRGLEVAFERFGTFQRDVRRLGSGWPAHIESGILPGDFSLTLELPAGRIGVVGLNSVFSVTSTKRNTRLQAFSPRQLHALTGNDPAAWAARHDFTLLITHHPPRAFSKPVRSWFGEKVGRFFDLHFCGATDGAGAIEQSHGANRSVVLQVGPFRGETKVQRRLAFGSATFGARTRVTIRARVWDREKAAFFADVRHQGSVEPPTFEIAGRATATPEPEPKAEPVPEPKAEPVSEPKAEPAHEAAAQPRSGDGFELPSSTEIAECWSLLRAVMLAYHVRRIGPDTDDKREVAKPEGWSEEEYRAIWSEAEWPSILATFLEPELDRTRRELAKHGVEPKGPDGAPLGDADFVLWALDAFVELYTKLAEADPKRRLTASVKEADLNHLGKTQHHLTSRLKLSEDRLAAENGTVSVELGFRELAEFYRVARSSAESLRTPDIVRRLIDGEEADSEAAVATAVGEAFNFASALFQKTWPTLRVGSVTIDAAVTPLIANVHLVQVFRPRWIELRGEWSRLGLCSGDENATEMAAVEMRHFVTALRAAVAPFERIVIDAYRLEEPANLPPVVRSRLEITPHPNQNIAKQVIAATPTNLVEAFVDAGRFVLFGVDQRYFADIDPERRGKLLAERWFAGGLGAAPPRP